MLSNTAVSTAARASASAWARGRRARRLGRTEQALAPGHVLHRHHARRPPVEDHVLRGHLDVEQRAVLAAVAERAPRHGDAARRIGGERGERRVERRPLLGRAEAVHGHRPELVGGVPVAAHGGVVDGQVAQRLAVVDHHRHRAAGEQLAVAPLALGGRRLGGPARGHVARPADDARDPPRGVAHEALAVVHPHPAAVAVAHAVLAREARARRIGQARRELGPDARRVVGVQLRAPPVDRRVDLVGPVADDVGEARRAGDAAGGEVGVVHVAGHRLGGEAVAPLAHAQRLLGLELRGRVLLHLHHLGEHAAGVAHREEVGARPHRRPWPAVVRAAS
jgi:hypothetical protein